MGCRPKMKKPFSSDACVCVYVKSEKTAKKNNYTLFIIRNVKACIGIKFQYKPFDLIIVSFGLRLVSSPFLYR